MVNVTSRIPYTICPKKGQTTTTVCRLLIAKRHYYKKLIPPTLNNQTLQPSTRSIIVYSPRPKRGIQPNTN